jgi:hypothetical protein
LKGLLVRFGTAHLNADTVVVFALAIKRAGQRCIPDRIGLSTNSVGISVLNVWIVLYNLAVIHDEICGSRAIVWVGEHGGDIPGHAHGGRSASGVVQDDILDASVF